MNVIYNIIVRSNFNTIMCIFSIFVKCISVVKNLVFHTCNGGKFKVDGGIGQFMYRVHFRLKSKCERPSINLNLVIRTA